MRRVFDVLLTAMPTVAGTGVSIAETIEPWARLLAIAVGIWCTIYVARRRGGDRE